jgi:tRNA dimethylallyltransferase
MSASISSEEGQSSSVSECSWSDLEKIDPEMAHRLHPHDHRRIHRSIEVFQQTGRLHSQLVKEVRRWAFEANIFSDNSLNRFLLQHPASLLLESSLVFWLDCREEVMISRIEGRVDEMVREGVVSEVRDLLPRLKRRFDEKRIFTVGLGQAIGFKEFAPLCDSNLSRGICLFCISSFLTFLSCIRR